MLARVETENEEHSFKSSQHRATATRQPLEEAQRRVFLYERQNGKLTIRFAQHFENV